MNKINFSIGIDIGGTNIELAWINNYGEIKKTIKYKTNNFPNADLFVNIISKEILSYNKNNNIVVKGIGIGAPNGNFFSGTIENAINLKWGKQIPLAILMEEKTKIPTRLTNDANAAAYAEMLYGNAKGMKNFVLITLGTGLGSGIVVDGKILYGSDGFAGEFGHTIAIRDGRLCACGRKGCLETYVSATGIVKTTEDLLKNKTTKSLLRKTLDINAENIYIAALKKDIIAIEAFQITGEILGKQLADYIALFSPEAIILSGGLAKSHDILIPIIKNSLNENILNIFKNKTKIIPSALLEKNAGLLGAAALVNNFPPF